MYLPFLYRALDGEAVPSLQPGRENVVASPLVTPTTAMVGDRQKVYISAELYSAENLSALRTWHDGCYCGSFDMA